MNKVKLNHEDDLVRVITMAALDVDNAFKEYNDEDKYHALELLEHKVIRVKAAILARMNVTYKSYPAETKPWLEHA